MSSTLPRLRRLKGLRRPKRPSIADPSTPRTLKQEEDSLTIWAEKLGSESYAKKMLAMQKHYITATLPELVTMDWLDQNRITYEYQVSLFGGRSRAGGGTVLDFLVIDGGEAMAWPVQGEYWHTMESVARRDKDIFMKLLGAEVRGYTIRAVVLLWEQDIYDKRPMIFQQALAGRSFR